MEDWSEAKVLESEVVEVVEGRRDSRTRKEEGKLLPLLLLLGRAGILSTSAKWAKSERRRRSALKLLPSACLPPMTHYRSAALDPSALSPQEYNEYIPTLSNAFQASFPSPSGGGALPPVEVWRWLVLWIDTVEERREKEVSCFALLCFALLQS